MSLSEQDLDFLANNHSAAMITVGHDGTPKAARVGVALVDGKPWSSGTADRVRTSRLRHDPRCTLFVYDTGYAWLALETSVTILDGPDAAERNLRLFRVHAGPADGPAELVRCRGRRGRLPEGDGRRGASHLRVRGAPHVRAALTGRMGEVTAEQSLAAGAAALAAGRWEDARTSFDDAVATGETAEGHFGLAAALWWLGENHGSVSHCTRAYPLFRRSGDVAGAVQCALWLGIVYKANFANFVAANGWIGRADRLLEALDQGPLHAESWVARAYRMPDLTPRRN